MSSAEHIHLWIQHIPPFYAFFTILEMGEEDVVKYGEEMKHSGGALEGNRLSVRSLRRNLTFVEARILLLISIVNSFAMYSIEDP